MSLDRTKKNRIEHRLIQMVLVEAHISQSQSVMQYQKVQITGFDKNINMERLLEKLCSGDDFLMQTPPTLNKLKPLVIYFIYMFSV